jgi:hypothetical protein
MEGLAEGLHSLLVGVLASLNSRDSYYTYREEGKHFSGGPEEHYGGSLLLVGVLASLNIRDSYYTYREKSKHFSAGPEEHYMWRVLLKVFFPFFLGYLASLNIRASYIHTERKANISLDTLKNIMEGLSFLLESSLGSTTETRGWMKRAVGLERLVCQKEERKLDKKSRKGSTVGRKNERKGKAVG